MSLSRNLTTRNNNNSFSIQKNQFKLTKTLTYQEDERNDNKNLFNYCKDFKCIKQCTSLHFGQEPIAQLCYVCPSCNPNRENKLCKYCYIKCHSVCRIREPLDSDKLIEAKNELKNETFACHCGIKLKHHPDKYKIKELIPCNMLQLDQMLKANGCWCMNHSIQVCCICSVTCHKTCNVIYEKQTASGVCNCRSDFHTSFNELALSFPLDDYKAKTGIAVWTIQILNLLFSTRNIFQKMSEFFIKTLHTNEGPIDNRFFPLLELFSNTLNRKFKTFYYDDDLINMFNYDYLIPFMFRLSMDNGPILLVRFRLLFILLFVHLKQDYQNIKTFTSIDFLTLPIIERLKYKKRLYVPNVTNEFILKKYYFKKENILKKIAIEDACKLMEIGMDYLSIEENQDEFEIGLKYLCFLLKRMAFNNDELDSLIKSLFSFYEKFFDYLNSDKSNIYSLLGIFNTLSEIYYMIAVSYNDNTVGDYLDRKSKELKGFIHSRSESGSLLFKMVLKSCDILKKHYLMIQKASNDIKSAEEKKRDAMILRHKMILQARIEATTTGVKLALPPNGGLIVEKIITIFNETLKIFALADNSFLQQIKKITKDDLVDYNSFNRKISKKTYGNFFFLSRLNKKDINNPILKLKENIEKYLYDLFTTSYSHNNMRIAHNITKELDDFIKILNVRFDHLDSINKKKKKKNNDSQEKKGIEQKKIEDFKQMIINNNVKFFPFFDNESFEENLDELIDCFTLFSLDETLTKLLVFFSNKDFPHLLTSDLLDLVFAFISLFMLTRNGMIYLLSGKNITRASKVFRRYSIRKDKKNIIPKYFRDFTLCMSFSGKALNFIRILAQGIKIYGLDMKRHKVLMRFKKNIIEHLQEIFQLPEYTNNLSLQVKTHLCHSMNFFHTLSDCYEFEDYEDIKRNLSNIFSYSKLSLNKKNKFVDLFSESQMYLHHQKGDSNNKYSETSSIFLGKSGLILNRSVNPLLMKKDKHKLRLCPTIVQKELPDFNEETMNPGDFPNIEHEIDIKMFMSFFSIISKNTYYVYVNSFEEDMYKRVFQYNRIEEYATVFNSSELRLNYRTTLLGYLRSFVFIEHLDNGNLFKGKEILSNKEYKSMIYNRLIRVEGLASEEISRKKISDLDPDEMMLLKNKLEAINQIEVVIDFYINELKEFPNQLPNESFKAIEEYTRELVFGTKYIADFFYFSGAIVNKIVLKFYKLTKEFMSKKNYFIKLLNDIKESDYIDYDSFTPEPPSDHLKELTTQKFNVYNKELLYKFISEDIEMIFKETGINSPVSLSNYLDVFDNMSEANFTPFSLIETYDYEYFYDLGNDDDDNESNDKLEAMIEDINQSYINQFVNITNTNFFQVITTISNESVRVDYRKKIVDYFHSFLLSKEGNLLDKLETLLCIIDKMLFYDGDEMQNRFEKFKEDQFFFPNINNVIHENILLTIISTKNIFNFEQSIRFISITKLAIQFIQLLGEGFNVDYHENIFKLQQNIQSQSKNKEDEDEDYDEDDDFDEEAFDEDEESEIHDPVTAQEIAAYKEITKTTETQDNLIAERNYFKLSDETIYDAIILNLKRTFNLMDIDRSINSEMPYDKLIVLTTNLIDFLIEYIDTKEELRCFIVKAMEFVLFGKKQLNKNSTAQLSKIDKKGLLDETLFSHINTTHADRFNYQLRKKIICYVKMKYVQLFISYLQAGKHDDMIERLLNHNCTPIQLFSEILFNFKQMINLLEETRPLLFQRLNKKQSDASFVKELIQIYVFDNIFIETIEFPLCMKLYILIKTYEDIYNIKTLKTHFEKLSHIKDEKNAKVKESIQFDDTDINSVFSKRIYLFLEQIILKVEIRLCEENAKDDTKKAKMKSDNISRILKSSSDLKQVEEKDPNDQDKIVKTIDNKEDDEDEENDDNDEDDEEEVSETKITFFVRPYLTYRLSKQSMISFEENVNRINATSKFVDMITFSDYSLLEMIINAHLIGKSTLKKFLSNLTYHHFEVINYLFLVLHNIFLIIHYYRSPNLDPSIYDVIDPDIQLYVFQDNYILGILQFAFLSLVLLNWLYFKFALCFQKCIMTRFNKTFIFRKKGENNLISNTIINYFQDMKVSLYSIINEKNKDIGFFWGLYVAFMDSLLFNREVCVYIYTIIFVSFYLKFESGLFLVFPLLFITNINITLFDIIKAIKMRFTTMVTILLFTALVVYIFMWITFFYMSFLFQMKVTEAESGMEIQESFCTSTIQCLLYILTSGMRAGGGIGEALPKISFRYDPYFFIKRFIYDMLFYIFIIMILFNMFMGIIVDTFAELRDNNYQRENDINNVCFICQLSRDGCLTKNIDYNTHVSKDHYVWNYVYFLVYLHINNPNDFNRIENYVWGKLEEYDFGWIPIDSNTE